MNLKNFNLGGLAAAVLAGVIASTAAVLNSGHSDPKSLGGALLVGTGGGLLAGLIPPHKDGSPSLLDSVAGYSALIPGNAGKTAQEVVGVAQSVAAQTAQSTGAPATAAVTVATPDATGGTVAATGAATAAPAAPSEPSNGSPTDAQKAALNNLLSQAEQLGVRELLKKAMG